jgi:hypothetical protein
VEVRSRTGRISPLLAALALLIACGSGGTADSTTTSLVPTTSEATSTSTSTTLEASSTSAPATTTTTMATTSSTQAAEPSEMPGEPVDFGPAEGDVLGVVGVAYDDALNLRAAPGADQEILARIPPLYDDLVARGETRELPRSLWIEVDYEGTDGWVNLRYTGYLGRTTDITVEFVDGLSAATMLELGLSVAEAQGHDRAEAVITSAPTDGDPGEVTLDVIGLEDDSVRGVRFHVVGRRAGGTFAIDQVESTTICARGVDGDGFCV